MKQTSLAAPTNVVSIDQVKNDVNDLLKDYFEGNIVRSRDFDDNYTDLWKNIESLSQAGGKRLRPYLLMLSYQGFGGKDYNLVLPVAAAQELLHLSLLIHDDIIDNDLIRYGQANIAGSMQQKYQQHTSKNEAAHFADGAAILAGDLLISGAHHLIVKSKLSAPQKLIALETLEEGIFMVGGGELIDMESVLRPFEDTDTLKIAEYKTAGYSFIVPLVTGARLAGASASDIELLRSFAVALGVGFQLADDLLGLYGEEAVIGKSTLSDIREGKRTYLMSKALSMATQKDVKILKQLIGSPDVTQAQANQVKSIVDKSGALAATRKKIAECVDSATSLLNQLTLSDESKSELKLFIKKATERSS